jgi:hypothetical protein
MKDFDPYQNAPPEIRQLRDQARVWRTAVEAANDERARLNQLILKARKAGVSFERIRGATGLGTGTIQMIEAKAGGL